MKKLLLINFALLLIIQFNACRKEKDLELNFNAATQNALAENTLDDIQAIADQASTGSLTHYRTSSSACATITHDTMATPHVLTIDFGDTNCTCVDGKTRRGKIIITYTGAYRDPGHTHTTSFDNYFVNDNQVTGSRNVTNNGLNTDGNLTYTVESNITILLADGGSFTRNANRTREWIEGVTTGTWSDDVYLITGSATGSDSDGRSYTATIITALRREIGCRWFVSGSIEIVPHTLNTRLLDFGDGVCDNQATVTINGNTHSITLH